MRLFECTDMFGDSLVVDLAGNQVVLTIMRKTDSEDYNHACVSLTLKQQRLLIAAMCR